MPPLPISLTVDPHDGYIAVVHQETPRARASLFLDPPTANNTGPQLQYWLGDLSANLDAIVRVPSGANPAPHYYALSRVEPVINQLRVQQDPTRPYLYLAHGDVPPDLALDVGIRAAVLDQCSVPDLSQEPSDTNPQRRMYATARPQPIDSSTPAASPEQLIQFDITDPDNPVAMNIMALPTGPSNLVIVPPPGGCGTGPTLAYVVSYDARKLYVIDVDNWIEFDQVQTQRGPNLPVLDSIHHQLYLVDFASMVVEVIDVDPRSPTFDKVLFTIGDPVLPEVM
jgi:hypothetical protein